MVGGQRGGKDDFPSASPVLFVSPSGSAHQLTRSLMLLMAGTLLQVQLPGPVTHHWALPPLPAIGFWVATSQSQKKHTWKRFSASPSPGLLPLHVLPSAMILAPISFLTSPAGNGSCLATIILFCWWSALISSSQLVSDPEAKRTHGKGNTMQNHSRFFWHA